MYTVFVVDDDLPVLHYLKEALPWEAVQCRLGGCFQDPEEALSAAGTSQVDILVTDIGMPGMDGMSLTRAMRLLHPKLKVVILSCHDEFDYAQQALKLHVTDYVLKETMTAGLIGDLLKQMKEALDAERSSEAAKRDMEAKVKQNNSLLRQAFMLHTIQSPLLNVKDWERRAQEYGIDFSQGEWLPVLAFPDRPREAVARFRTPELLRDTAENILAEALGTGACRVFPYQQGELLLLFPFSSEHRIGSWKQVEEMLRIQQRCLLQYGKVSYSFMVGLPCKEPLRLKENLAALVELGKERFYMPHGSVGRMEQALPVAGLGDELLAQYVPALEDFRQLVLQEKTDSIAATVGKWMGVMRENRFHPVEVKEWMLKIVLEIRLRLKSLQMTQTSFSSGLLHHDVMELASLQELGEWLQHFLNQAVECAGRIRKESKRREVLECQRFVAGKWQERVGLEEAAAHLHLHPNYLSRLFKRETGENFVEFVTRTKMEKAKELLERTDKTVEEIAAMLSYENKNYFTKLFKAHTGALPSAYRSSRKG
ncbi:hypothetical protein QJ48_02630 [Paenibacillus sp. A3]|uniref:response regulator transcription factor n=1 Tax=Paenibacillus sp. A3 TaxID=1337054 RepID=UPI0006D545C0|nr:helix-turn-helix domain-containing protein [Paenibacillus sp. A3]KPV60983.1 hypothetical protein QJ48_02630 [Paenibacillus sp. A3]